jgi:HTH-like domain
VKDWQHVWPVSDRQHGDMKVLAHICEQYDLSLSTYGRTSMTMELKEAGLDVGERRVCRLMHINGIKPVRTRRLKVTTNSKWAGDTGTGHSITRHGGETSQSTTRLHHSQRPRQPVLRLRLPEATSKIWADAIDERRR